MLLSLVFTKQNCFQYQNRNDTPHVPFVPYFLLLAEGTLRTFVIPLLLLSVYDRVRSNNENLNRLSHIHSGICRGLMCLR